MSIWGKYIGVMGLTCLLLGGGCREDAPADAATPVAAAAHATDAGFRYYHLKGSLDTMTITMELQEEPDLYLRDGRRFRGFYRYDAYGGPIGVYGTLTDGDRLTLEEQGSWEGHPHRFEGRWSEDGGFSGSWHHHDGKVVHAFQLVPDRAAVPLAEFQMEDSLVAFPHWPASPVLHHSVAWLDVAARKNEAEHHAFLHREIARGLLGDAAAAELPNRLRELRAELYADFREEMEALHAGGLIDSLTDPELFASYHYAYRTSMQVYYNSPALLSIGYTDYAYTGGAHGMYTTRVAAYDLTRNRVLRLEDVLRPGYVEAVSQALDRAVRIKYNLGDRAPLNTFLFEDRIAPNDNYGFTDKGVFFVYAPYEIAPYAAGEIELFVAFEQINDYVKEEWLP